MDIGTCLDNGCSRTVLARGLCNTHYGRWWADGDPDFSTPIAEKIPGRGCSVSDCPAKHKGHGFCEKHLERWKKHGDPLAGGFVPAPIRTTPVRLRLPNNATIADRLAFYEPDENGCWIWQRSMQVLKGGEVRYGRVSLPGRGYVLAHRAMYEHMVGPIPDGMFVMHTCDVPACVNPEHLQLGTHTDNVRDMHEKGRASKAGAKLTESDVLAIRADRRTSTEVAASYGVSASSIRLIRRRKTWKHV